MAGFMAGWVARFAEVPAVSAYRLTLCHTTAGYKLSSVAIMSDPSAKIATRVGPTSSREDRQACSSKTKPGAFEPFCLSPAFPFHFVETNSPSFHIDHRRPKARPKIDLEATVRHIQRWVLPRTLETENSDSQSRIEKVIHFESIEAARGMNAISRKKSTARDHPQTTIGLPLGLLRDVAIT